MRDDLCTCELTDDPTNWVDTSGYCASCSGQDEDLWAQYNGNGNDNDVELYVPASSELAYLAAAEKLGMSADTLRLVVDSS